MAHEKEVGALSGWLVVLIVLIVGAAAVWTMFNFDAPRGEFDWVKAFGRADGTGRGEQPGAGWGSFCSGGLFDENQTKKSPRRKSRAGKINLRVI